MCVCGGGGGERGGGEDQHEEGGANHGEKTFSFHKKETHTQTQSNGGIKQKPTCLPFCEFAQGRFPLA